MVGISLFALLTTTGWLVYQRSVVKAKEAQTKWNLSQIESALRAYWDDYEETVPEDINELLRLGYLEQMPTNAFSGQPMRNLLLGEKDNEGDFSYIPRRALRRYYTGRPDLHCCAYYELLAYRSRKTDGQHLDQGAYAGTVIDTAYPLHIIISRSNDILCGHSHYIPANSGAGWRSESEDLASAIRRLSAKAAAGRVAGPSGST